MEVVIQRDFEGKQYEAVLGLKGAAGKVALLRLKSATLQIELFEFTRPVPSPGEPQRPVSDHGITHFCIEVVDIESEYTRMKAAGVFFHCSPTDFGVAKATYGRDPDGNVFELWEKQIDTDG